MKHHARSFLAQVGESAILGGVQAQIVKFCEDPRRQRIAYAVMGSGPPLICSAWWVSHLERDMRNPRFRSFFERLAQHCTVVRYDRLGVGLSDRDRASFGIEGAADELAAVIDATGFPSVSVFGVSCGGPPLIRYAYEHPQKLRKLIFFGSYSDGPSIGTQELQAALPELVRASWGLGSRTLTDLFAPDLSRDDVKRMSVDQRDSCSAETAAKLLEMSFSMSAPEIVPAVPIPALVMHRQGDRTVGFERGRELAAQLPQASFLPLEGKAHVPWEGDAEKVLEAMLDFLGCSPVPEVFVEEASASDATLKRLGDLWILAFRGRTVHMKHSKGLGDLAHLLACPHQDVPAIELVAGPSEALPPTPREQEVLDEKARREIRSRVAELERELAEAERWQDLGRLSSLREEREVLLAELSAASCLGGRQRAFSHPKEKARKAVSARIRSAIQKISEAHADLGAHLRASVSTGLKCCYRPEGDPPPTWVVLSTQG